MLCCNLSSTLSCNFDAFVPVLWQTTNKYINQSKSINQSINQSINHLLTNAYPFVFVKAS